MVQAHDPIRIFVAMPGSDMGPKAKWTHIDSIKAELLEPVRARLAADTGREVELYIEKDKFQIGPIHKSMFTEALVADVYIADLTGANPNVYLELGVRWALRDAVTIPIAQDPRDVLFNAQPNRMVIYGQNIDEKGAAIEKIVKAALLGLTSKGVVDNPVRESLDVVMVPRAELAGLHQAIEDLRSQRADDLIEIALRTTSPDDQINYLREALTRNPVHRDGWYELGTRLRRQSRYPEAIGALDELVRLYPDDADGWRELGVAASKNGELDRASAALNEAVRLNPADGEAWSNLGGMERRRARTSTPGVFLGERLTEAMNAYHHAAKIRENDTYPLMNEARIKLLLGANDDRLRAEALDSLAKLELLARYQVQSSSPERHWKHYDLADTLLLRGRTADGLAAVEDAIAATPRDEFRSTLSSVVEPLRDFLSVPNSLDQEAAEAVRAAVARYEEAISAQAAEATSDG
uniref:tetratricopeptide repeat protein n=1 Tax=Paractinoplanes polyasparticus TaxID=2856853 RepID=UPI001C844973|nr:tetratricopeptide repeat protein [Actinoplanes polyasparticus]